jgi:hypothetical protein
MTTDKQATTLVKVWHNGRFHRVEYNAMTAPVLCQLHHTEFGEYHNPLPHEWAILSQYRTLEK